MAQRVLSEPEAAGLVKLLESLVLEERRAVHGPPPGGSLHFEVRYRRLGPRTLAEAERVSAGTSYFVLSESQAGALHGALQA